MNELCYKISTNASCICQLDDAAINRIAAGEVVERPASAVKELVENAIDATARNITVEFAHGGKTLIRVRDDGCGMSDVDLPMALSRHATSKIDGSDLLNISSFGFRGEALPSLGAVGKLRIASRTETAEGHEIHVTGGDQSAVTPAATNPGTLVELRDLFYATPARLKFLRSDRAEAQAISDIVKRLALSAPDIGFSLLDRTQDVARKLIQVAPETGDLFDALRGRARAIIGAEFVDNAIRIGAEREGIALTGYASLPTFSRGAAVMQYVFVNGRPVRDKLLIGALRAAYQDVLSRDRHPAVVLFINLPPSRVDVNVHPAKSEVRFRDPGLVRGLLISALRHGLAEAGHRSATTISHATLGAFRTEPPQGTEAKDTRTLPHYQGNYGSSAARSAGYHMQTPEPPQNAPNAYSFAEAQQNFSPQAAPPATTQADIAEMPLAYPLGAARAQLHENYIVAQTQDGLVIVDQHAAHERLVYEKMKTQLAENGIERQGLLIPEILELSAQDAALLLEHQEMLAEVGVKIESFGPATIAVRETPALLGTIHIEPLLRDVLDALNDGGIADDISRKIDAVLSRISCHGSVRSGRRMNGAEMNALLRQMEATPLSGQCNHGRPTYVSLSLSDIERLFGRR